MIPSRGLSRGIPSLGPRKHLSPSLIPSRTYPRLAQGRNLSTSLRTRLGGNNGLSAVRHQTFAATAVLGGVNSSRNFSIGGLSLWGSSKKTDGSAAGSSTPAETTQAASTTSAAQSAPVEPAAVDISTVLPTEPDLSVIESLINGQDILNIPEGIGYLHTLGLDYGWGPSSIMEWLIEHVHVWGGLSWGATLIAVPILLRVAMFYPQLRSLQNNAKATLMRQDERFQDIEKMRKDPDMYRDPQARMQFQVLSGALKNEYNIKTSDMMWGFLQIPFSFGLFRVVKGMVDLPVPALETTGFWWFTDLTATDPYYLLPLISGALMSIAMSLSFKFMAGSQKQFAKKLVYIVAPISMFVSIWFSCGINLLACAFGAATVAQTLVFNNRAVRKLVGLPLEPPAERPKLGPDGKPVYSPPRAPATTMKERWNNMITDAKKAASSSQMGSMLDRDEGVTEERAQKKKMRDMEADRLTQRRANFDYKYKDSRYGKEQSRRQ